MKLRQPGPPTASLATSDRRQARTGARVESYPGLTREGLLADVERITRLGNRFVGSEGEALCRELLIGEMEDAGLERVRSEPVEYLGFGDATASCRASDGSWAAEGCVPIQYTAAAEVEAEAIYVGEGSAADIDFVEQLGVRLKGKIAVVRAALVVRVAEALAERGAAAIVQVSPTLGDEPGHFSARFGPPPVRSDWGQWPLSVPGVSIAEVEAHRLLAALSAGPVSLRVEHEVVYGEQATANVVGEMPGTEADGTLIAVGAHYDSQRAGVGACDNASGLAALLAICRHVGAIRPRRGLLAVAFAAEELGAWGSNAFVAEAPDRTSRIAAMVNLDALGSPISATRNVIAHRQLRETASECAMAVGWEPEEYLDPDDLPLADHAPFAAAGIPTCWLMRYPPNHPYYHTAGDTLRHIDPARLLQDVEVNLGLIIRLANDGAVDPRGPAVVPRGVDDHNE